MAYGKTVAQMDVNFGFSLMPYLGTGNVSVSPASLRTALAMLYEGATGETAKQIAKAAYLPEKNGVRQKGFAELTDALNAANAAYTLRCANALWSSNEFPVSDDFRQTLKKCYNAEAYNAHFKTNPEGERKKINKFVSCKTEKKIQELFSQDSITVETILVLANALYFKALWNNKFNPKYTKAQPFILSDGNTVDVQMMRKGKVDSRQLPEFYYGEFDGVQAVALPYKGLQLETIALLPPEGTSVVELEEQLRTGALSFDDVLQGMKEQRFARLEIPKHELKGSYDLKAPLMNIGIERIFSEENAELSRIASTGDKQLHVSSGMHKTYFKTDEKGSEGAAATGFAVTLTTAVRPTASVEFVADKPFLELIMHQSSRACLFINRVEDPR